MYSQLEAAYLILKEYKKPLKVKEIIQIALERSMIKTNGKTPDATLRVAISAEIQRRSLNNTELRFYRFGNEHIGLVEWGQQKLSEYEKQLGKPKFYVQKGYITKTLK